MRKRERKKNGERKSHPLGERTILEYRRSLSFCEKDLVNYLLAILQELRNCEYIIIKKKEKKTASERIDSWSVAGVRINGVRMRE